MTPSESGSVAMPSLLEQIKEALANATPGPWRWNEEHGRDFTDEGWSVINVWRGVASNTVAELGPSEQEDPQADAHLIAHAPSWLSALVEVVERLRGLDTITWLEQHDADLAGRDAEIERLRETLTEVCVATEKYLDQEGPSTADALCETDHGDNLHAALIHAYRELHEPPAAAALEHHARD
jgi:hypothetical protein